MITHNLRFLIFLNLFLYILETNSGNISYNSFKNSTNSIRFSNTNLYELVLINGTHKNFVDIINKISIVGYIWHKKKIKMNKEQHSINGNMKSNKKSSNYSIKKEEFYNNVKFVDELELAEEYLLTNDKINKKTDIFSDNKEIVKNITETSDLTIFFSEKEENIIRKKEICEILNNLAYESITQSNFYYIIRKVNDYVQNPDFYSTDIFKDVDYHTEIKIIRWCKKLDNYKDYSYDSDYDGGYKKDLSYRNKRKHIILSNVLSVKNSEYLSFLDNNNDDEVFFSANLEIEKTISNIKKYLIENNINSHYMFKCKIINNEYNFIKFFSIKGISFLLKLTANVKVVLYQLFCEIVIFKDISKYANFIINNKFKKSDYLYLGVFPLELFTRRHSVHKRTFIAHNKIGALQKILSKFVKLIKSRDCEEFEQLVKSLMYDKIVNSDYYESVITNNVSDIRKVLTDNINKKYEISSNNKKIIQMYNSEIHRLILENNILNQMKSFMNLANSEREISANFIKESVLRNLNQEKLTKLLEELTKISTVVNKNELLELISYIKNNVEAITDFKFNNKTVVSLYKYKLIRNNLISRSSTSDEKRVIFCRKFGRLNKDKSIEKDYRKNKEELELSLISMNADEEIEYIKNEKNIRFNRDKINERLSINKYEDNESRKMSNAELLKLHEKEISDEIDKYIPNKVDNDKLIDFLEKEELISEENLSAIKRYYFGKSKKYSAGSKELFYSVKFNQKGFINFAKEGHIECRISNLDKRDIENSEFTDIMLINDNESFQFVINYINLMIDDTTVTKKSDFAEKSEKITLTINEIKNNLDKSIETMNSKSVRINEKKREKINQSIIRLNSIIDKYSDEIMINRNMKINPNLIDGVSENSLILLSQKQVNYDIEHKELSKISEFNEDNRGKMVSYLEKGLIDHKIEKISNYLRNRLKERKNERNVNLLKIEKGIYHEMRNIDSSLIVKREERISDLFKFEKEKTYKGNQDQIKSEEEEKKRLFQEEEKMRSLEETLDEIEDKVQKLDILLLGQSSEINEIKVKLTDTDRKKIEEFKRKLEVEKIKILREKEKMKAFKVEEIMDIKSESEMIKDFRLKEDQEITLIKIKRGYMTNKEIEHYSKENSMKRMKKYLEREGNEQEKYRIINLKQDLRNKVIKKFEERSTKLEKLKINNLSFNSSLGNLLIVRCPYIDKNNYDIELMRYISDYRQILIDKRDNIARKGVLSKKEIEESQRLINRESRQALRDIVNDFRYDDNSKFAILKKRMILFNNFIKGKKGEDLIKLEENKDVEILCLKTGDYKNFRIIIVMSKLNKELTAKIDEFRAASKKKQDDIKNMEFKFVEIFDAREKLSEVNREITTLREKIKKDSEVIAVYRRATKRGHFFSDEQEIGISMILKDLEKSESTISSYFTDKQDLEYILKDKKHKISRNSKFSEVNLDSREKQMKNFTKRKEQLKKEYLEFVDESNKLIRFNKTLKTIIEPIMNEIQKNENVKELFWDIERNNTIPVENILFSHISEKMINNTNVIRSIREKMSVLKKNMILMSAAEYMGMIEKAEAGEFSEKVLEDTGIVIDFVNKMDKVEQTLKKKMINKFLSKEKKGVYRDIDEMNERFKKFTIAVKTNLIIKRTLRKQLNCNLKAIRMKIRMDTEIVNKYNIYSVNKIDYFAELLRDEKDKIIFNKKK